MFSWGLTVVGAVGLRSVDSVQPERVSEGFRVMVLPRRRGDLPHLKDDRMIDECKVKSGVRWEKNL